MKYLLVVLGIFVSSLVHAQFGFYAEGGLNYADLHVTRSAGEVTGKGGVGWQVGGGVEYHTQFGYFLYLGTQFASEQFKKDSVSQGFQSVVSNYTYKPLFVNVPFGIGYQFNLAKDIGFRVYGGLNTQVGVGGKVTRNTNFYTQDSATGQPIQVRTDNDTHKLNFGRSIQVQSEFRSDLANTVWGLNIGAGLNFSKSIEVAVIYQEGLTNILPGGDAAPEVNKLRSVTVNLKFYFPKNYYTTKQKL
ncbi:MAG: outer membrane beta-barrel protein [Parafilimonas sp.]